MASQLSKKAALPLAKILATCCNNVSNTGPCVDLPSTRSFDTHSRALFTGKSKCQHRRVLCLKSMHLKSQPHLPGDNALTHMKKQWSCMSSSIIFLYINNASGLFHRNHLFKSSRQTWFYELPSGLVAVLEGLLHDNISDILWYPYDSFVNVVWYMKHSWNSWLRKKTYEAVFYFEVSAVATGSIECHCDIIRG